MNITHKILALGSVAFLASNLSFAGDREFAYTYPSNNLKKGQREIEVWNTLRTGREQFYNGLDHRLEFETGITNRLQSAFYINFGSTAQFGKINNGYKLDSGNTITPVTVDGVVRSVNFGISSEWKYQLSDPVANAIGSALYGEISLSPEEVELEGKIILDKDFGNFYSAFNVVTELEFEKEAKEKETDTELEETTLELDYGLNYHFSKRFALGLELRSHNIFEEGEFEHSAFFAGPALSYKSDNWWAVLGVMPQVTDFKGSGPDLDDHEQINARLLFSFML
jgi:hypothetical protein